jgi:L,D-transpeptidase ErfK/SrfK
MVRHSSLCLPILLFLFLGSGNAFAALAVEGDLIGEINAYTVQPKDTLYRIARRFDVGIIELMAANPDVDTWMPKAGMELIIPTQHILPPVPRDGIVINLSEMRLFYFADPATVMTFPIGIGMEGWQTRTGSTSIVKKRKDPTWIPPDSIRAENPSLPEFFPPGPDNPLGKFALNLGFEGYLIHGTNRPDGIGRRSSHGCIRLYPEDIEALFNTVEKGIPVVILDMPYKIGWRHNTLFLEVSPTQRQSDQILKRRPLNILDIPEVYGDIKTIAQSSEIDWRAVREAVMWRSGIPVAIAVRTTGYRQE